MQGTRNVNVDLLRGICAYVVVFIHTPGDSHRLFWLNVLPPANAVFALLAGWYMMAGLTHCAASRPETTRSEAILSWLKDRGRRILFPYAFWSLIYIGLNVVLDWLLRKPSNYDFGSLSQWLSIIFLGGGATQLWFLVTLFYAQALLYIYWILVDISFGCKDDATSKQISELKILSQIANNKKFGLLRRVGDVKYALKLGGVLLIACICFGLYDQCSERSQFPATLYFMAKFLFLGAFLAIFSSLIKRHGALILLLSIGFIIIRSTVHFEMWGTAGDAYALAWLLVAQSLPSYHLPKVISDLGNYSMGIYLIHCLIIIGLSTVMRKIGLDCVIQSVPALAMAFVYFMISWVAIVMLRRFKIPGL